MAVDEKPPGERNCLYPVSENQMETILFFLSRRVAASTSRGLKRSRLQPRPNPARPSTCPHHRRRTTALRPALPPRLPPRAALPPDHPQRTSYHWGRRRHAHPPGSPARHRHVPRLAFDPEWNRQIPPRPRPQNSFTSLRYHRLNAQLSSSFLLKSCNLRRQRYSCYVDVAVLRSSSGMEKWSGVRSSHSKHAINLA